MKQSKSFTKVEGITSESVFKLLNHQVQKEKNPAADEKQTHDHLITRHDFYHCFTIAAQKNRPILSEANI